MVGYNRHCILATRCPNCTWAQSKNLVITNCHFQSDIIFSHSTNEPSLNIVHITLNRYLTLISGGPSQKCANSFITFSTVLRPNCTLMSLETAVLFFHVSNSHNTQIAMHLCPTASKQATQPYSLCYRWHRFIESCGRIS
jgi:hypothetical protein